MGDRGSRTKRSCVLASLICSADGVVGPPPPNPCQTTWAHPVGVMGYTEKANQGDDPCQHVPNKRTIHCTCHDVLVCVLLVHGCQWGVGGGTKCWFSSAQGTTFLGEIGWGLYGLFRKLSKGAFRRCLGRVGGKWPPAKVVQQTPQTPLWAPVPPPHGLAVSRATWLKSQFRGHLPQVQHPRFCGFHTLSCLLLGRVQHMLLCMCWPTRYRMRT